MKLNLHLIFKSHLFGHLKATNIICWNICPLTSLRPITFQAHYWWSYPPREHPRSPNLSCQQLEGTLELCGNEELTSLNYLHDWISFECGEEFNYQHVEVSKFNSIDEFVLLLSWSRWCQCINNRKPKGKHDVSC